MIHVSATCKYRLTDYSKQNSQLRPSPRAVTLVTRLSRVFKPPNGKSLTHTSRRAWGESRDEIGTLAHTKAKSNEGRSGSPGLEAQRSDDVAGGNIAKLSLGAGNGVRTAPICCNLYHGGQLHTRLGRASLRRGAASLGSCRCYSQAGWLSCQKHGGRGAGWWGRSANRAQRGRLSEKCMRIAGMRVAFAPGVSGNINRFLRAEQS